MICLDYTKFGRDIEESKFQFDNLELSRIIQHKNLSTRPLEVREQYRTIS